MYNNIADNNTTVFLYFRNKNNKKGILPKTKSGNTLC